MNQFFETHGDWAIGAVLALAAFSDGIIEWIARLC